MCVSWIGVEGVMGSRSIKNSSFTLLVIYLPLRLIIIVRSSHMIIHSDTCDKGRIKVKRGPGPMSPTRPHESSN